MYHKLLYTGDSYSSFFLRISLGSVMLAHGLQQTIGLLGGVGLVQKLNYYNSLGVPRFIGTLGILVITVGSILLILGYETRLMGFCIGLFLLTALFMGHHIQNGFFMNWESERPGEGYEYHILGLGISLALILYGGGKLSVDRYLSHR